MDARLRRGLLAPRSAKKKWDPEYVAGLNGLAEREQLVRVHSGTEYWVASLGFWPGLPFMMALDPRSRLTAPKYNPPRTWTPQGTVGMGGASTAIYPVATPGGYQIFARIPMPIWDTRAAISGVRASICLFQPGRPRASSCRSRSEEFEEIEAQVKDGSYVYNVVDYQKFSVAQLPATGWPASTPASGSRRASAMFEVIVAGPGNLRAGLSRPHRLLEPGLPALRADGQLVVPAGQSAGRQHGGAAGLECQYHRADLAVQRDGVIAVTGADMSADARRPRRCRCGRALREGGPDAEDGLRRSSAPAPISPSPAASTRRPGSVRARPSTRPASAAWTAAR